MQRPQTFGELICRVAPALPDDAYRCPPIVATALETTDGRGGKRRPFWVLIHSITDRGMKLLHSQPLGRCCLSLCIEGDGTEVVQVLLVAGGSRPNGKLHETQAEFQRVGRDVASTA